MKIKRIISQHRRDFKAEYVCGHCGHEVVRNGYDDEYFHRQVIPNMKCENCSKKGEPDYRPLGTRYAESEQV